ncbi:MAG TPA: glycosyltransferase family 2 protein [Pyrinomonadaceae bacterium]|jgi:glycosyltransferase involved in cell wall biosynthesis
MSESKPLKLNVILPTYNRAALLRRTLESLANAEIAPTLDVLATVVDNNSSDETRETIEEFVKKQGKVRFEYLFEKQQGRSAALNAGIKKSKTDLIATIDDDEEVAADWFVEIARLFGSRWNEIDFAGGKVLPRWENEPPAWVSKNWAGIGWRDYGDAEWIYDETTPILSGGHAILKRTLFAELGFYHEALGATGKNLMSCEDDVFFDKLILAGKRGVYCPNLVIYHFVPSFRLTCNYLRQWSFGNGVSQNLVDLYHKPFDGARLLGVPRFMYREAALSLWKTLAANLSGRRVAAFAEERAFWIFWGYFYARNIQNSRLESPIKFVGERIFAQANR